jgi:hypothetical protein
MQLYLFYFRDIKKQFAVKWFESQKLDKFYV